LPGFIGTTHSFACHIDIAGHDEFTSLGNRASTRGSIF
jgi:hypothetical protein